MHEPSFCFAEGWIWQHKTLGSLYAQLVSQSWSTPCVKSKDKPCSDSVQSPLHCRCGPFHSPAFFSSYCSGLKLHQSWFSCVRAAIALSRLSPKLSNEFPSKEKEFQVLKAWTDKGWCSRTPRMDTVCVCTLLRGFEANIAQGPYLGTFSARFWLVFLWLEPPGPTGSMDSPSPAEDSEKCFQPTCSGVTSHFCQSFPHSLLFHSWDPFLPLVAAAQQLRWAISCTPVWCCNVGKILYLPISCLTSYREWSFLRVATFFAAWSFLALEMKKNVRVTIQIMIYTSI